MKLKWDDHVGAAAIIGVGGFISTMVMIGIAWGAMSGKIDTAATKADEAITIASVLDHRVGEQSERLGKIETSLQFIVPAIGRIENKLDAKP
jgi:hypothetical protein